MLLRKMLKNHLHKMWTCWRGTEKVTKTITGLGAPLVCIGAEGTERSAWRREGCSLAVPEGGPIKKTESNFLHGQIGTGQGRTGSN